MEQEFSNSIGNIHTIENGENFGIKSENSIFVTSFFFEDFYDDAAVKRFIKSTEKLIRTSKEYSDYIEKVRTSVKGMDSDSILSKLTSNDVDLELHHYPFSLYDICSIVMTKHVVNKENVTTFSLANEVLELHFKHLIGLVSLMETNHDLAHTGNLFLNSRQIFGDYKGFISIYKDYIPATLLMQIEMMEEMSRANVPSDFGGVL